MTATTLTRVPAASPAPTLVRVDGMAISLVPGGHKVGFAQRENDSLRFPAVLIWSSRGSAQLSLGTSGLVLEPGDFAVASNSPALTLLVPQMAETLVVRLPVSAIASLQCRLGDGAILAAGEDVVARSLVVSALGSFAALQSSYIAPEPGQLTDAFVRMMSFALDQSEQDDSSILGRAKALIRNRLRDEDLSPELIAASLNISSRTLQRAFRKEQVTVSRWIRCIRLEQCRIDLDNANLDHVPVAGVGASWGIWDPGHFSRLFKAEFGVSPQRFRQQRDRSVA